MDDNTRARLLDWLNNKWKKHPCPVCTVTDWQVGGDLAQVPSYVDRRTPFEATSVYPVLPIFCRNCGYIEFINALLAGILDPNAAATEDAQAVTEEG